MAEKPHQRSSKHRGDGLGSAGCMWGLFNAFDAHHRFRLPKMLVDRRSAHRRHVAGAKDAQKKTDAHPLTDERGAYPNNLEPVEVGVDTHTGKNSGLSWRKPSIGQEISRQHEDYTSKQKDNKKKATPFASRLLCTISIQHAESDLEHAHSNTDEGPPNMAVMQLRRASPFPPPDSSVHPLYSDEGKNPTLLPAHDEIGKGKRYCGACGAAITDPAGHMCREKLDELGYQLLEKQALLRKKLREARENLLGLQEGDDEELEEENVRRRHTSDIMEEALELFNANNKLFLKLLREPDSDMTSVYSQLGQEDRKGGGIEATSCDSFPGSASSPRKGSSFKHKGDSKNIESSPRSANQKLKTLAAWGNPEGDSSQSTLNAPPRTAAMFTPACLGTDFSSEHPTSFSQAGKRRRESGLAASRFKIIKQRIKEIILDNKKECQRIVMDRVLHKVPADKFSSLERFSDETSRASLGSDHAGIFTCKSNSFSSMPRSQSLSESVEKYAHLLESCSRREPNKPQVPERLKLAHEDGDVSQTVALQTPRAFGKNFSLPELQACSQKDDHNEESSLDLSNRCPSSVQDPAKGNGEESNDVKQIDEQNSSGGSPENRKLAVTVSDGHELDISSSLLSMECAASAPFEEQVSESRDKTCNSMEEPRSPVAADSNIAGHCITEGSEFEVDQVHSEVEDVSDNRHDQSDAGDDPNINEAYEVSNASDAQASVATLDFDAAFPAAPVEEHEAEFNYVKDVLKSYLFDGDETSNRRQYCTSGKLSDTASVSEESEQISVHETEPGNIHSQFDIDRELLYDLTVQALIEIYGSASCSLTPWAWNAGPPQVRPVAMGFHLLEEVWASISRHLKAQPPTNTTLEHVLEKDLRRNDGWMNLSPDIEYVGLDLEATLLDDLMDETLFEVLEWDYVECPAS